MTGLVLAGFIIAFGFVTAAIVTKFYALLFSQDGRVTISFQTMQQIILGIIFFMISGPYLVLSNGFALWRQGDVPTGFAGFCLLASMFWSFCLGILIVQLVFMLGLAELSFNAN